MAEISQSRHVFLSYSRRDAAFMRRVCDDLSAEGLTVWTDETGLEPGTPDWEAAIDEALEQAGCMIVLLSPEAKESRWVGIETARAEARGTPIIPVLLYGESLDAVPLRLTNYQRIDAREDYRRAADQLVKVVCGHMGVEPLSVQRDRAARPRVSVSPPARGTAPGKRPFLSRPLVWIGCAALIIIPCVFLMAVGGGPAVRWLADILFPPPTPPPQTIQTIPPEEDQPPPIPEPSGELDPSLPPNYGRVDLTSGFLPDPQSAYVAAGGGVFAGDSAPGCAGHVTRQPDLHFFWNDGGDFLRLFFVADDVTGDTTLVVFDPDGDWECNDDFFGLNPALDFEGAPSGFYAIWVGSYRENEIISGTLYFSEFRTEPEDLP
jgi:hypothetical protein